MTNTITDKVTALANDPDIQKLMVDVVKETCPDVKRMASDGEITSDEHHELIGKTDVAIIKAVAALPADDVQKLQDLQTANAAAGAQGLSMQDLSNFVSGLPAAKAAAQECFSGVTPGRQ